MGDKIQDQKSSQLDAFFSQIKTRYAQIKKGSSQEGAFLAHLQSLGYWEQEPADYPEVTADFSRTVPIAYAVCHPDCGIKQLIVEGSTQECQRCGRLMFRVETRNYTLEPK